MNYHRDRDYLVNEDLFRNIFQKRFGVIKKHLGGVHSATIRGGCVLDIGCSTGLFLDIFKNYGWETWGVEPSSSAERAKLKGHRIINNTFEKSVLPNKYFDLVVLNHVLEHMENPYSVLKKVNEILKTGGIVYVDVPNAGGVSARLLGKKWPLLLPAEHKHQFTQQILKAHLEKAGFTVIHRQSRSGLFEYQNPWLELWQAFKGLKKRFLTDLFGFPGALIATLANQGSSLSIISVK